MNEERLELLQKLMKDARNMRKNFYRQYLIEIDPDDPKNIKKMQVKGKGGYMNKGYTQFENVEENEFKFQINQDNFLSYDDLEETLKDWAEYQIQESNVK